VVQKYVHALTGWKELSTEQQEAVIGRTKSDNIELTMRRARPEVAQDLSTIVDDAGLEHDILRDNMPFGSPARPSTARTSSATRANCGSSRRCSSACSSATRPEHDRLLDVSTALTGGVFFVPPVTLLAGLGE
jgi:putative iron-dependent peroxidase